MPADVYRTLRDCLSFMDWERFQSGFSRHEHHLQYTPQARGLDWGGPGHVTPATVCLLPTHPAAARVASVLPLTPVGCGGTSHVTLVPATQTRDACFQCDSHGSTAHLREHAGALQRGVFAQASRPE